MAKFDLSKGGIRTSRKKAPKRAADMPPNPNDELSMSVSSVCGEPGHMYAFVRFEDKGRYCEYKFPDVELKVNDGFTEDELVQLKFYVKNNILQLKKMAASVDPFHALKNG